MHFRKITLAVLRRAGGGGRTVRRREVSLEAKEFRKEYITPYSGSLLSIQSPLKVLYPDLVRQRVPVRTITYSIYVVLALR